jgi:ABC-2 type transport system ATP-binding protein
MNAIVKPPPDLSEVALAIDRVSHAYGEHHALRDVSLTLRQAQFAALLGLNGAGKTTLLSLITRLFNTRAGTISVMGHRLDRAPGEALRRLGVVFQARTLDLDLSVMDNLLFHAALHGIGWRQARHLADSALADVDLATRARDKARLLSGGQMRRVEIARALLHTPSLLVLDEPTVGLDVASKHAIITHVRSLVRARGVAVLWTTHLLDEIEPTDHVTILHRGCVLAQGPGADIVARAGGDSLHAAFTTLTSALREAA